MPFAKSTIIRNARFILLCIAIIINLAGCKDGAVTSDDNKNKESIFDHLTSNEILEFELSTNIDSLKINKNEESYQPALFTYYDSSGNPVKYEIEVSARGVTRKNLCSITPMRLKFPRQLLKDAGLGGNKTLKLVTPCNDSANYEDLLLREYLCYRLYQLFTDQCLRVQLSKFKLYNRATGTQIIDRYAFLIEHHDQMAQRLNGKILDNDESKLKSINMESYNLLTVFQYMIGNTDWNLSLRHNIKLVQTEERSSPVPVPYDFDFSGLVNAPYAKPHPNIPINHVRERLFQWRGKNPEPLEKCILIFREKKDEIFDLLQTIQNLAPESSRDITEYISAFFEVIESDQPVESLIATRNARNKNSD